MKVNEVLWFSSSTGICGIVLAEEDNTHDPVAYIGVVKGIGERDDTESIVAWGQRFTKDTVERIARHFDKR